MGRSGAPRRPAPPPLLRPLDPAGSKGVALHVAQRGQQVRVLLDGKAFEPTLIQVPVPDGVMGLLPALSMRQRQPAHELRQFPLMAGPHDQTPLIYHQAPPEAPDWPPLRRHPPHLT